MFEYNKNLCVICREKFDTENDTGDKLEMSEKGIDTLQQCSEMRTDVELTDYLF